MDPKIAALISIVFAFLNISGALHGNVISIICLVVCIAAAVYNIRNIIGR